MKRIFLILVVLCGLSIHALGRAPFQQASLTDQAKQAFGQGDYAKAIALATEAIKANPKDEEALNTRGCAYDLSKKQKEAIADFDAAIALNPKNAMFFANRGRAKYRLNQYKSSLEDLDQAAALNAKDEGTHSWRGIVLFAMERYPESLLSYQEASKLNPGSASDLAMVARGQRYVGQLDNALATSDQAYKLDPNSAEVLQERTRSRISAENYPEALTCAEEYVKKFPKSQNSHYDRARALIGLARGADAINELNQAIEINPSFTSAYQRRAELLRDSGKLAAALDDEKKYELLAGHAYEPASDAYKIPIPTTGHAFTGYIPDKPDDETIWNRSDTPWRKDEPPIKPTEQLGDPASLDFEEYQAMVRQAMEMIKGIYGDLTPDEENQFQAKWAPVLNFPSAEGFAYFRKLNPLLDQYLNLRGAFTMASAEFDQSWERAGLAAGLGYEGDTKDLAGQADEIRRTMQALLAQLKDVTAQIKALGDPPNPLRARKRARAAFERAVSKLGPATETETGTGLLGEWEGTFVYTGVDGKEANPAPAHIFLIRPPAKSTMEKQIALVTMYGPYFGYYGRFIYHLLNLQDMGGGRYEEPGPSSWGMLWGDSPIKMVLSGNTLVINTDYHQDNAVAGHLVYTFHRLSGDDIGLGPKGVTLADAAALRAKSNAMEKTGPPKTGNDTEDMKAEMVWFDKANQLANYAYMIENYYPTRYSIRLALKGFKAKDPTEYFDELEKRVGEVGPQATALAEKDKAASARTRAKQRRRECGGRDRSRHRREERPHLRNQQGHRELPEELDGVAGGAFGRKRSGSCETAPAADYCSSDSDPGEPRADRFDSDRNDRGAEDSLAGACPPAIDSERRDGSSPPHALQ